MVKLKDYIEIIGIAAVVFSLGFVAYEIRQNNDLMAADARQVRTSIVIDAWRFAAENGDLAELRVRERNGEELTRAERERVDALVMAVLVSLDWQFGEMSKDSPELHQVLENQRYNFAKKSEYRRVWKDRKNAFRPEFVQWIDENVVDRAPR